MNRLLRATLAVGIGSLVLAGCKGEEKLTVYNLAPDAGTAAGYAGGTPITLADGTFVTLPEGAKVTSPTIPEGTKTSARPTKTARDGSVPATTPSTYLVTTGTTSRTAQSTDGLKFPALGIYQFHDTITPDDGSPGVDHETFFKLSSDTADTVRVQETSEAGAPKSPGYYEERHDSDGLWLVASALSNGVCKWEPKSAALPAKVVEGKTVSTTTTCVSGDTKLELTTKVAFKVIRDVTIDGRTLRCIDVTRHRVLSDGSSTVTSDAVDTYSFELGMRVAVSEHSTTQSDKGTSGFTRNLVLVSLPS